MKVSVFRHAALVAGAWGLTSAAAMGQDAAEPADGLPEVEVIQQKAPAAKQATPVAKAAPPPQSPIPQPPPEPAFLDEAPAIANSPYGSPASVGAQDRAYQSAISPVNPTQIIPENLEGFAAAATNLTPDLLTERQPRNLNEALSRVPGVIVINDDAAGHHGGVTLRGSPARRSRKMLVMEDGHAVNLALWLDPSVHYWGPVERYESVEVLRGTVINHGPNNNFGVINARNLSPFGPAETVISSAIGFTKTRRGSFREIDEVETDGEIEFDDDVRSRKSETDLSYRWHVHTRQHADNVGLVASYSGANVQGAWDSEKLRFHDFYGALGWRGSSSDVVVSLLYARQRDNYDEQNFLGEAEIDTADEDVAEQVFEDHLIGFAERQFKQLKHCKTCFAPAAGLNNYNGDIWRGQIVHNAYLDDDTTITTRLYAGHHTRDRYQLNTFDANPTGTPGAAPIVDGGGGINDEADVYFGENTMFGRLRTFRHVGAEVRGEWANRRLLGFNQDIQAGIRYEYQDMTNRNFLGRENEILKEGDEDGLTIFDRALDVNSVSAFLMTNVKVASNFNVVPGIRFEWFEVGRRNRVIAREESEAGGADGPECAPFGGDCLELDGILFNPDPSRESYSSFNALPGVSFAYTGFKNTTIFGGYHRGLTTLVLRNEDFPAPDEIGDNFNVGLRTTAIKGVDFEVAAFYQRLSDYQFGASFSNVAGDRSFGLAEEVEISGVELYGRLNSQPFTGGSLNFFGESNYTYSRGRFTDAIIGGENYNGNRIPEVPEHVAAFTLGVEQTTGWRWDASVTWAYRGGFFTDEGNLGYGAGGEVECEAGECEVEEAGEDGFVPSVWLLSARFNLAIGDTGASIFVAGDNLLDEFYITDREDGMKPGLGRTIWTGFKYKF